MKRALNKHKPVVWHYRNDERVDGAPSGVWGDLSGVRGDLSGVWGDLSGVGGDLSGVRGDLSDCELTNDERKQGINISELIKD